MLLYFKVVQCHLREHLHYGATTRLATSLTIIIVLDLAQCSPLQPSQFFNNDFSIQFFFPCKKYQYSYLLPLHFTYSVFTGFLSTAVLLSQIYLKFCSLSYSFSSQYSLRLLKYRMGKGGQSFQQFFITEQALCLQSSSQYCILSRIFSCFLFCELVPFHIYMSPLTRIWLKGQLEGTPKLFGPPSFCFCCSEKMDICYLIFFVKFWGTMEEECFHWVNCIQKGQKNLIFVIQNISFRSSLLCFLMSLLHEKLEFQTLLREQEKQSSFTYYRPSEDFYWHQCFYSIWYCYLERNEYNWAGQEPLDWRGYSPDTQKQCEVCQRAAEFDFEADGQSWQANVDSCTAFNSQQFILIININNKPVRKFRQKKEEEAEKQIQNQKF